MASTFQGVAGAAPLAFNPTPGVEDIDRNLDAAREVVDRMAGMLENLQSTATMVPRSEWSVGEHAAHIAFANIGFGMFALGMEYPYGDGTQAGLAEANETSLIGFPEREGRALAEQLRQSVETFAQVAAGTPADKECPSPLGTMPLGVLTSYFLIHNLMHGCAIAAGLNRDFLFEAKHFPLVWPMVAHTLPSFVNSSVGGLAGCVQLRTEGFESVLEVADSRLKVLPAPAGGVDCCVDAEPVHLFLVLIKMLTVEEAVDLGQMKLSGTNPDLFASVMRALDIP